MSVSRSKIAARPFGAAVVERDRAAEGVQRHAGREVLAGRGDHQHARIAGLRGASA
jgi:hypothetical protein